MNQVNLASMESELISSFPLTNESGEPVFVIVQLELQNAIIPSRPTEDLTHNLRDLIGPSEKLLPYPYTGDLAEEQYIHCVRKLAEIMVESYRVINLFHD